MRSFFSSGCLALTVVLGVTAVLLFVAANEIVGMAAMPTGFASVFVGVAMGISLAAYVGMTTFGSKARSTKRTTPPKSRFIVTKEGEIMEVVDDEKRKRG